MKKKDGKISIRSSVDAGSWKRFILPAIPVIFIILVFCAQNIHIILLEKQGGGGLSTDGHLSRSANFYNNNFEFFESVEYYHSHSGKVNITGSPYPPLVYILSSPFYSRRGVSITAARISLIIYWPVFLLSMFGIGVKLGGYRAGLATMVLSAACPHILNIGRMYVLDFPQTAFIALCFFLLLQSEGFKKFSFSILFGVALGLSMLVKWSTIIFLALPVLWFLFQGFRSEKNREKTGYIYSGALLFSIGGIAWYVISAVNTGQSGGWLAKYLIITVLPLVICILSLLFMDKGIALKGEKGLINGPLSLILSGVIAGLWYFPAVLQLVDFTGRQGAVGRILEVNLKMMLGILYSMFNFAPILIVAGIFLIFIGENGIKLFTDDEKGHRVLQLSIPLSRRFFNLLLLPLNIIFLSVVSLYLFFTEVRHYLPFVVFCAPLAGYWIDRAKRFKTMLLLFILAISLMSILSWTVFPAEGPLFNPVNIEFPVIGSLQPCIFCPWKPQIGKMEFGKIIGDLPERGGTLLLLNLVEESMLSPLTTDRLAWEFQKEDRAFIVHGCGSSFNVPENIRPNIRWVLMVLDKKGNSGHGTAKIATVLNRPVHSEKEYDIDGNFRYILLEFED